MPKTLTPSMSSHILSEVTTLCTCWKIVRTDGVTLGFTDHDKDILYASVNYQSSGGYNRTAVSNDETLAVPSLDVIGVLSSDAITKEDLRAGLYDYATIEVFHLNWQDIGMGMIPIRKGTLGEVVINQDGTFSAELRGLSQLLNYTFGEIYTPSCRADLGDTRCGVSLAAYTVAGTVATAPSRSSFTSTALTQADDYFNGGAVRWITGDNAGAVMEVRDFVASSDLVTLFMAMPYPIQPGDTFEIYPGCDKTRARCAFFNNVVNFRGEPDIPGRDAVTQYPDAT